jgi:hypothetical protein
MTHLEPKIRALKQKKNRTPEEDRRLNRYVAEEREEERNKKLRKRIMR